MSTGEQDPGAPTRRRRNHAIWIGVLVTFLGAITYFNVFARFPALRDFPWINLPLVLLGVALSALAVWRAFASGSLYRGKILGSLGLLVSLGFAGLFCTYIFVWSYALPAPTEISRSIDVAPDFTLLDQHGQPVSLSDHRGSRVVLTFYRGHW